VALILYLPDVPKVNTRENETSTSEANVDAVILQGADVDRENPCGRFDDVTFVKLPTPMLPRLTTTLSTWVG
jgi:hypothetical protein